jgi:hypothetical protein
MSQLGMVKYWIGHRRSDPKWKRDLPIHGIGLVLCAAILMIMLFEKLTEGGWITLLVTTGLIFICILIRHHYRAVSRAVRNVDRTFANLPKLLPAAASTPEFDPTKPTAVILVGGYGGLGLHILTTVLRLFPDAFHNVVFASVGVIDSAFFGQQDHVDSTEHQTRTMLDRYVEISRKMGRPAKAMFRLGTEVVDEASALCTEIAGQCARTVFFAGTLVFDKPHWYHRVLHNETAYAIQRQLKFAGMPMVILPLLLHEPENPKKRAHDAAAEIRDAAQEEPRSKPPVTPGP